MADIFISYDSADKERVRSLVAVLEEQGWTVWWDRRIPPGRKFADVIEGAIQAASCVIVVWSGASVDSDWVKREAAEAQRRGILVPVKFDDATIPFQFRDTHAAGLVGHPETSNETELRELLSAIGSLVSDPVTEMPTPADEPSKAEVEAPSVAQQPGPEPPPVHEPGPVAAFLRTHRLAAVVVAAVLILSVGWAVRKALQPAAIESVAAGAEQPEKPSVEEAARSADSRRVEGAPTWDEDEKLNGGILIEGGEFMMGSPEGVGETDEHPQHLVRLSPFYLQEHEVTNEEYRRFKAGYEYPQGEEKHPVVNVTWQEASDYASSLGGRLPTEAEWEYAARGGGLERAYPWGDQKADCSRAVMKDASGISGCGQGGTWPVCSKPEGNTKQGLCDMAGNVWEWVADWYGRYPEGPQVDPLNPDFISGGRVVRGGSFFYPAGDARSADRAGVEPGGRNGHLGFRVVLPAP